MSSRDHDDVPRLPRGRGLRLSGPELLRILVIAVLLVTVITIQRPCSDAVARFIAGFDPPAASIDAAPPVAPDQYIHLRPDMTEAELRAAIDRARAAVPRPLDAPTGALDGGVR